MKQWLSYLAEKGSNYAIKFSLTFVSTHKSESRIRSNLGKADHLQYMKWKGILFFIIFIYLFH